MKILITGGCGYLGCSVLEYLLLTKELEEVIIYDSLYRKNANFFLREKLPNPQKVRFIQGDILDTYTFERALKGVEVVLHLAAKVSTPFADTNGHEFDQINNWGTGIVADVLEQQNSVRKVIYSSSIAVYGDTQGKPVDEESITAPKSFYGISKLKGEKHIQRLSKKKETMIFRIGNVFGYNPCIRLDAVINRFLFDAQTRGRIEIHGNGEQKRPFTSVACVGQYLAKACLQEHNTGIFNLVNYNLTINEVAAYVQELYPDLEQLRLDQHMEMRSSAATSGTLNNFQDCFESFDFHLQQLKHKFSF